MNQTTITLANGQQLLLVEIAKEAKDLILGIYNLHYWIDDVEKTEFVGYSETERQVLGTYTAGAIDFTEKVREEWVEKVVLKKLDFYRDYNPIEKAKTHPSKFARVVATYIESFLSLLQRQTPNSEARWAVILITETQTP